MAEGEALQQRRVELGTELIVRKSTPAAPHVGERRRSYERDGRGANLDDGTRCRRVLEGEGKTVRLRMRRAADSPAFGTGHGSPKPKLRCTTFDFFVMREVPRPSKTIFV